MFGDVCSAATSTLRDTCAGERLAVGAVTIDFTVLTCATSTLRDTCARERLAAGAVTIGFTVWTCATGLLFEEDALVARGAAG